jgi:hypothetical protein
LNTKDFLYAGKSLQYQGQTKTYPAIIDTGSSFIAVPPDHYQTLQDKWKESVADLDCKTDSTFCQTLMPCEHIAPKLSNVGFNVEDTLFEMTPMAYLHQGKDDICQFAIAQNPLDKFNNGNFLFGGLFLKHFYSIYDFDNELISLGVNSHSANMVYMHGVNEPIKNATLFPPKSNGTSDHEEAYDRASSVNSSSQENKTTNLG